MYYIESSKALRAEFVEMADMGQFNDSIFCEDPKRFIAESLNDGLIEECSGAPIIDRRYKKEQLQEICRKFGLRVSGKKSELIERLRLDASDWFRGETELQKLWQLTEKGRQVAMRLAADIGQELGEFEMYLTRLLLKEDVDGAWNAWSNWNSEQPNPICPQDNFWPGTRPFTLSDFQRVAGEAFTVLPAGEAAVFLSGLLMDKHLLYQDSEQTKLRRKLSSDYLKGALSTPGVIGVTFSASPASDCVFSKAYEGDYRSEDVPLLPPSLCTNEPGCCCGMIAIFDDDSAGSRTWKKPVRRDPAAACKIQREAKNLTGNEVRHLCEVINKAVGPALSNADIEAAALRAEDRYQEIERPIGAPFSVDSSAQAEKKPGGLFAWLKSLF